jgi:hypothetical protein
VDMRGKVLRNINDRKRKCHLIPVNATFITSIKSSESSWEFVTSDGGYRIRV